MQESVKGGNARIELSLDKPETDKLLHLQGDYISIVTITGVGTCKLKLNHRHAREIDMREVTNINGSYDKVYLTTDGDGGLCTMYVGHGVGLHVSPDPGKLWAGGVTGGQIETHLTIVGRLAYTVVRLKNVKIYNSNGFYPCYLGPYVSDAATFKLYAYVLMPHKMIEFTMLEMSSLAILSYDGVHNVTVDVLGLTD